MKLVIETNETFIKANDAFKFGQNVVLITPPLDENYWALRVRVSKDQAIVAFPKFSTVGIGFQRETDWNTNLPYNCDTYAIYKHIRHNKGDTQIRKKTCMDAIKMLQERIAEIGVKNFQR